MDLTPRRSIVVLVCTMAAAIGMARAYEQPSPPPADLQADYLVPDRAYTGAPDLDQDVQSEDTAAGASKCLLYGRLLGLLRDREATPVLVAAMFSVDITSVRKSVAFYGLVRRLNAPGGTGSGRAAAVARLSDSVSRYVLTHCTGTAGELYATGTPDQARAYGREQLMFGVEPGREYGEEPRGQEEEERKRQEEEEEEKRRQQREEEEEERRQQREEEEEERRQQREEEEEERRQQREEEEEERRQQREEEEEERRQQREEEEEERRRKEEKERRRREEVEKRRRQEEKPDEEEQWPNDELWQRKSGDEQPRTNDNAGREVFSRFNQTPKITDILERFRQAYGRQQENPTGFWSFNQPNGVNRIPLHALNLV